MSGTGAFASMGLSFFVIMMLVSGSCNTLLMKFMVMQEAPTGPHSQPTGFDQPYLQTLFMMVGEFLCLVVFYLTRRPNEENQVESGKAPVHIFGIACLFDWTATTMVNMAYGLIAASVVQMTRGAIVIFTCLFSVTFLGKRQYAYHIVGVALVALGITLVSLSTFFNPVSGHADEASKAAKIFGISLCVGAQVAQASMLVYEEKIMGNYVVPPLQVVGMEGAFGIAFGVMLVSFLNYVRVEDTPGAYYQISHSTPLLVAIVASIFSIAFFNFSGVTVTQRASAVARSTIDVSRTIIIWAVELFLGWNHFNVLQFAGFIVLALGTMLYNRLIVIQALEPTPEALSLKEQMNKV